MNVARFFTSGYLAKKFIVLCNRSTQSQTDWKNVKSAVGYYDQFYLFKTILSTTEVEG